MVAGIFDANDCAAKTKLEEENHDLSTFSPISPLRILRPNPNLEICFDTRTRNAVYVQHRLVVDGEQSRNRRLHFHEDKTIEERYRSRNSYYHLTGYDRGHLAPAADFADNQQLNDSYNLCNVSPQNSDMNRKIWAWLEDWTRQVAKRAWQKDRAVTYVTTGPLWLPRVQVAEKVFRYNIVGIGKPPALVMVPTHFFKVVVVVKNSTILHFACFVVPNEDSANEKPLQNYVVSWSDLETVTGLALYPGLVDDAFKARADLLTQHATPNNGSGKLLLLTDGSSSNKSAPVSKKTFHEMRHLCDNQTCVPRKQRQ
jgi:endonuclease G, mitochondrial